MAMSRENNPGPAHCRFDISNGLSRDEIRIRWLRGDYGPHGKRPQPSHVDGWLRQEGK